MTFIKNLASCYDRDGQRYGVSCKNKDIKLIAYLDDGATLTHTETFKSQKEAKDKFSEILLNFQYFLDFNSDRLFGDDFNVTWI